MRANHPPTSPRPWLIGGLAVLALGGAVAWIVMADVPWQAIPRAMGRLDTVAILGLTAVLPVAGFPISMVYLLLGARFGPAAGLGVVGGITAIHLLATHWITRSFLRRPLMRFMSRHHHRAPAVLPGENGAVALMIMIAPAIPYFVRNYVLALSGIPLRVYFGIALPVHVARSYVVLFLGDFGGSPTPRGLVLLGVLFALQFTILAGLAWWLRRHHQRLLRRKA
jgi:uncharacterized membrane protein YdjX (TVP38/TMEM64 family)